MTVSEFINKVGFQVKQEDINGVNQAMAGIKNTAGKLLGAIGIGLSLSGVKNFLQDCVSISSEVEEMQNKFNVVFQGITQTVEDWAQSYSDAIGRNKNDIKQYLADQQNLLVGFGMTREEGFELSKQMTSLALDLASFANLDESSAINWMTKAVMGESEAAKNLGTVLNDTTRAEAMLALGMSGTYESLDQLSKMQVNYQAIVSQSTDAVGDCERSLGSYASTMKQFQAKLKEVKTLVGQFFMPTFAKVLKFGTQALTMLRNGIQRINDFATRIGGAERILAVLAVTLALVMGYLNFSKITSGLKAVAKVLSGIKASTLGVVAVFLILALLVEDFIGFMQGRDSLFGTLLQNAGVDVDKFRENVTRIWKNLQTILGAIWQGIKNVAIPIFQGIWKAVKGVFEGIGGIIEKVAPKFAELIDQMANGEVDTEQWEEFGEKWGKIIAFAAGVVAAILAVIKVIKTVKTVISGVKTAITGAKAAFAVISNLNPVSLIIIGIIALIAAIVLLVKNWDKVKEVALKVWTAITDAFGKLGNWFKSKVVDPIANFFSGLWNGAKNVVTGFIDWIGGSWEKIVGFFINPFGTIFAYLYENFEGFRNFVDRIFTGIVTIVTNIKNAIVEGFNAAIEWITGLPEKALTWGKDIIQGIIDGIKGAIDKVGEAVGEVADKIKSFLGFSEPEDGPLSNFHTYMPDMIDLMAKGIKDGKKKIKEVLGDLTGDMSVMASANLVSGGTLGSVTNSSSTRSIVQNVNISNKFEGDRAGQQKSAQAMSKATEDTTSELARALAYTR